MTMKTILVPIPDTAVNTIAAAAEQVLQVAVLETLGEPAAERRQQRARFGRASPNMAQAAKARRGAQLPTLRVLFPRQRDGHAQGGLSRILIARGPEQLPLEPVQLRPEPALPGLLD
jgi:hypothetical protein